VQPRVHQPLALRRALGARRHGHVAREPHPLEGLGRHRGARVRFLDDVIDVNAYPKPQIEEIVKGNRKIGLGVMGWADMLFRPGRPLRFGAGPLALARSLMRFIRDEAWKASQDLAADRGPVPRTGRERLVRRPPLLLAGAPMRNAMVTTVAPTGTISILAGCSAGIEPLYSLAFVRQILNGEQLPGVHPYFLEVAEREKFAVARPSTSVWSGGQLPEDRGNPRAVARTSSPAPTT
jgi:ribonucleoside-diphosphate reductase alpha chain